MKLHWREAVLDDLLRIGEIASSVHITLPESPEVFADKISLSSQTSFVLQAGDTIAGYALAHPWNLYSIPALDSLLGELPHDADCMYIHDVVVLPEFRGRQAAASAVKTISQLTRAKDFRFLALVSVYQTTTMWKRFGFRIANADVTLMAKLKAYGDTAKYMICDLDKLHPVLDIAS